jgi:hypothetical protein
MNILFFLMGPPTPIVPWFRLNGAGPVPLPLGLVLGTFSVNGLAANDALCRFTESVE